MLLEGVQLGHYTLLKRIGGGGMGDVYLAEDPQISQKVAIKVIKTEATLSMNGKLMHDFREEARAIAQLEHPSIMPLLSYGEDEVGGDTIAYMVMPYRKEGNLVQWLRQQSTISELSLLERGNLIQQAAIALQYAHDHHMVHRDIKPSNFLVRTNPTRPQQPDLLLSDFGLAKLMNATSSASQNVRGTPTYMAPEQWSGTALPASDQYSLAIMAYEMLTGHTPFHGNPLQMMHQHLNALPPSPLSFNPDLPEGVADVLLRALRKNPADRYPSVATFAENLLHALNERTFASVNSDDLPEVAAIPRGKQSTDNESITVLPVPLPTVKDNTTFHTPEPDTNTANARDTVYVEQTANQDTLSAITAPFQPSRPAKRKKFVTLIAAIIVGFLLVGSLIWTILNVTAQTPAANHGKTNHPAAYIVTGDATAETTFSPTATTHSTSTAQKPKSSSSTPSTFSSNPTAQPTTSQAQPTPTPRPTPRPTPTPTPSPKYPSVAGSHSGLIENTNYKVKAYLTLNFTQNQGTLGGYCSIGSPLYGSGYIYNGTITTGGYVNFYVYDSADRLTTHFWGQFYNNGTQLAGYYTSSVNQGGVWAVNM